MENNDMRNESQAEAGDGDRDAEKNLSVGGK